MRQCSSTCWSCATQGNLTHCVCSLGMCFFALKQDRYQKKQNVLLYTTSNYKTTVSPLKTKTFSLKICHTLLQPQRWLCICACAQRCVCVCTRMCWRGYGQYEHVTYARTKII
jgi:hypothetical protein